MKAEDLIPPDFKRCQAYPNVADYSFMTLGPMPKPVRCDAAPVWLAVETKPGEAGGRWFARQYDALSKLLRADDGK